MNLKDAMLSKIHRSQKDNCCIWLYLYEAPRAVKLIEAEGRMVVARSGRERRKEGFASNEHTVSA